MMILIKFGKKEYLEKTQAGSLFMRSAKYYINLEKSTGCAGTGDVLDSGFNLENTKMEMRTLDGELVGRGKIDNLRFDYVSEKPIYCCMLIDESNLKWIQEDLYQLIFEEKEAEMLMKDYNEYDSALIINGDVLSERISLSLFEQGLSGIGKSVLYGDSRKRGFERLVASVKSTEDMDEASFFKDSRFKHQQEYRFVIDNHKLEKESDALILEIGNIEEESIMIDKEQIFDGKIFINKNKIYLAKSNGKCDQ